LERSYKSSNFLSFSLFHDQIEVSSLIYWIELGLFPKVLLKREKNPNSPPKSVPEESAQGENLPPLQQANQNKDQCPNKDNREDSAQKKIIKESSKEFSASMSVPPPAIVPNTMPQKCGKLHS